MGGHASAAALFAHCSPGIRRALRLVRSAKPKMCLFAVSYPFCVTSFSCQGEVHTLLSRAAVPLRLAAPRVDNRHLIGQRRASAACSGLLQPVSRERQRTQGHFQRAHRTGDRHRLEARRRRHSRVRVPGQDYQNLACAFRQVPGRSATLRRRPPETERQTETERQKDRERKRE